MSVIRWIECNKPTVLARKGDLEHYAIFADKDVAQHTADSWRKKGFRASVYLRRIHVDGIIIERYVMIARHAPRENVLAEAPPA